MFVFRRPAMVIKTTQEFGQQGERVAPDPEFAEKAHEEAFRAATLKWRYIEFRDRALKEGRVVDARNWEKEIAEQDRLMKFHQANAQRYAPLPERPNVPGEAERKTIAQGITFPGFK